jgi:hypothetical protein
MTAKPHSILRVVWHRLRTALEALLGIPEQDAPAKWAIEEAAVSARLRPQLGPEISLAREIEGFAFEVISSIVTLRQPADVFQAHATLATRALQDLRVCVSAVLSGYTMQGWTVASCAFEAAHASGFIGEDLARAQKWLKHRQLEKSVIPVRDSIVGTFIYLEMATDASDRNRLVDNEYELYRYLCLAKHVNPVAEKYRYWVRAEKGTRLMFTPFYTPGRVREARLGLGLANRAALLATWIVARAHSASFTAIEPKLKSLANRTGQAVRDWKALAEGD